VSPLAARALRVELAAQLPTAAVVPAARASERVPAGLPATVAPAPVQVLVLEPAATQVWTAVGPIATAARALGRTPVARPATVAPVPVPEPAATQVWTAVGPTATAARALGRTPVARPATAAPVPVLEPAATQVWTAAVPLAIAVQVPAPAESKSVLARRGLVQAFATSERTLAYPAPAFG